MSELTSLTIAEAREKLRAREITATELTEAYISAIDAANGQLNAYIKTTPDLARVMAYGALCRRRSGCCCCFATVVYGALGGARGRGRLVRGMVDWT